MLRDERKWFIALVFVLCFIWGTNIILDSLPPTAIDQAEAQIVQPEIQVEIVEPIWEGTSTEVCYVFVDPSTNLNVTPTVFTYKLNDEETKTELLATVTMTYLTDYTASPVCVWLPPASMRIVKSVLGYNEKKLTISVTWKWGNPLQCGGVDCEGKGKATLLVKNLRFL